MEREYLIKPFLTKQYTEISHGKGIYLYDKSGKEYIDGSSGAVTVNIGHGVEEVVTAMKEQAEKVAFVYRSQFTNDSAEQLAEKIASMTPGDLNWTFFVNSGSEATETAMKVAIQYWQEKGMGSKQKIISRWMSYHGITMGALSMSGHPLRRKRFVSLLEDYPIVSPPRGIEHAEELEVAIQQIGAEQVAAFIAEPIVGAAGGALTPPDGYYERIREICDKYNILFIADEVMTGIGRTGKMFAMEHWGIVPDIIALGKGLSSGYTPIAATVVSDRVMAPIIQGSKLIMSGHTFSANPLSSAVALAVLRYMETNDVVAQAKKNGEYLLNCLEKIKEKYAFIEEIRGKGMLLGIEFSPTILNTNIIDVAFEHGLLLYPAVGGIYGKDENCCLVAPPLTITRGEIDELARRLERSFASYERRMDGAE
ncbi:aspartate aminotransferase family protein [Priestia taiwanensis]|uniref:Aspartate aminotransferase family protein n=1 Tax=Priestia taiwanensis TaxID=1347902 RepID=A0A917AKY6_9BACI|nr:aspartate aminotransferase family protein [Priestia taiwanensis]MBM7362147.1 adenosylmethionine-8-amino-7-oxononanoate aminotransferase [Priestia taiwanensis]GGE59805.1 aspartate aminotransferase family protein [Priestia taiwanensis]